MNLLLDTHLLLWAAGHPDRLSAVATTLLLDPSHELLFSAASIWEVTIKRGLGRDDFQVDPRRFWRTLLTHGYRELTVTSEQTIAVGQLPPLHKDPFDRLLVAQARTEGLTLLTTDTLVTQYGEPTRLV
ncbi:type II toxin-antitoxin system VapC family toxin [uncultured Thiodictyon sp.]|uniref:type II toxin-antitoxin system VapC family toxin n=1 Tax=uncultured Thiodictyon sp. TaxID=1846217 RepID=UPI0025ECEF0A|nr:type II toxin-antitoxin system VapC family toxin [uncultured Thiodictyon sp.]